MFLLDYVEVSIDDVLKGQIQLESFRSKSNAETLVKILCGDDELLTESLIDVCPQMKCLSNDIPTREEIEKLLITAVGIDFVIDADKKFGKNYNGQYQNSLMELRNARGKDITQKARLLKDTKERENFISGLSIYSQEDFVRMDNNLNNLQDVNNDLIKML